MSTALLLIAHGSRHQEANEDLVHVAEQMRRRGDFASVQPSFLDLVGPTIDEGGANCLGPGVDRVVMLPYFLSPGVHVKRDLAEARGRLAARHPGVEFLLAEPMGRHPLLVDVVADRVRQAMGA